MIFSSFIPTLIKGFLLKKQIIKIKKLIFSSKEGGMLSEPVKKGPAPQHWL